MITNSFQHEREQGEKKETLKLDGKHRITMCYYKVSDGFAMRASVRFLFFASYLCIFLFIFYITATHVFAYHMCVFFIFAHFKFSAILVLMRRPFLINYLQLLYYFSNLSRCLAFV